MLRITSAYSGKSTSINEDQLRGILTSNKNEALRLSTFDAIKNFFIKILNLLPWINFFDKQEFLEKLYTQFQEITFYDSRMIASPDCYPEKNIKDIWKLFILVAGMSEKLQMEKFRFRMEITQNTSFHDISNTILTISFDNKDIAEINSGMSRDKKVKLIQLANAFLTRQDGEPSVFMLDIMKMDPDSPLALFLPSAEIDKFYQS